MDAQEKIHATLTRVGHKVEALTNGEPYVSIDDLDYDNPNTASGSWTPADDEIGARGAHGRMTEDGLPAGLREMPLG